MKTLDKKFMFEMGNSVAMCKEKYCLMLHYAKLQQIILGSKPIKNNTSSL